MYVKIQAIITECKKPPVCDVLYVLLALLPLPLLLRVLPSTCCSDVSPSKGIIADNRRHSFVYWQLKALKYCED